jgi:hypothetical protein
MRALILCMLCVLATVASAQPKLLVVFVHQAVDHDAIVGRVPSQSAWVVWERDAAEPYRLATGRQIEPLPSNRPALQIASPANATAARHRLLVRSGAPREVLSLTLASRLQRIGKRGVYLHTPQSPSPTPYALLAVASDAAAPVRVFPSLEAMRLAFFSLEADWALLELKRWDYRALELLLAEGVEVWVLAIPSPSDEMRFGETRLSAVVRFAAREPSGLLTSPSTRWNGVIREVDLAPTLYRALTSQRGDGWLGSPAFETRQSDWHRFWNGWLARVALRETTEAVGLGVRSNALTRSAEWAQANERLTPTFRAALLGVYLGWLGGGVALWRLRWLRGRAKRVFVSGLAVFALAPAVGIAYAYAPFALWTGEWQADAATLAGWLTGCWAALSLLMAGVARWGQVPLLGAAVMVALAVLGADILIAGGYGVNRSLFSAGISSVPAFGVGEVFWAFALAAGLFAPASWLESRGRLRLGRARAGSAGDGVWVAADAVWAAVAGRGVGRMAADDARVRAGCRHIHGATAAADRHPPARACGRCVAGGGRVAHGAGGRHRRAPAVAASGRLGTRLVGRARMAVRAIGVAKRHQRGRAAGVCATPHASAACGNAPSSCARRCLRGYSAQASRCWSARSSPASSSLPWG